MTTFTNIHKRSLNFNFQQPRSQEEIIKEMLDNQKRYQQPQYKIVGESNSKLEKSEQDYINDKNDNIVKGTIKKVKEESKQKDYKEAKVIDNFDTDVEKKLDDSFQREGKENIWIVHSRTPNKVLIKILLPLTKDINEKKLIVNEKSNEEIDEAKKNQSIKEFKINNKIIKLKFIGVAK